MLVLKREEDTWTQCARGNYQPCCETKRTLCSPSHKITLGGRDSIQLAGTGILLSPQIFMLFAFINTSSEFFYPKLRLCECNHKSIAAKAPTILTSEYFQKNTPKFLTLIISSTVLFITYHHRPTCGPPQAPWPPHAQGNTVASTHRPRFRPNYSHD